MNNKTTIDMAHVWKQSLVNKVTRKVKVMDPEGNPVSLTYFVTEKSFFNLRVVLN